MFIELHGNAAAVILSYEPLKSELHVYNKLQTDTCLERSLM